MIISQPASLYCLFYLMLEMLDLILCFGDGIGPRNFLIGVSQITCTWYWSRAPSLPQPWHNILDDENVITITIDVHQEKLPLDSSDPPSAFKTHY